MFGRAAAGDDHVFAGGGGQPGGLQLAGHAPFAHAAGTVADQVEDRAVQPLDRGDQPAAGPRRIAVVQPIHVGEQHQERGPDQVRHDGRQAVVVAEGGLQLLDADRVVLVDDRDGPQFQQGEQGIAGVEVAGAMFEVLGGQQDLGGVMAVGRKRPLVGLDQQALADGGDGLEVGQVGGRGLSVPGVPCRPPRPRN